MRGFSIKLQNEELRCRSDPQDVQGPQSISPVTTLAKIRFPRVAMLVLARCLIERHRMGSALEKHPACRDDDVICDHVRELLACAVDDIFLKGLDEAVKVK